MPGADSCSMGCRGGQLELLNGCRGREFLFHGMPGAGWNMCADARNRWFFHGMPGAVCMRLNGCLVRRVSLDARGQLRPLGGCHRRIGALGQRPGAGCLVDRPGQLWMFAGCNGMFYWHSLYCFHSFTGVCQIHEVQVFPSSLHCGF
jgi:hypothetical protein